MATLNDYRNEIRKTQGWFTTRYLLNSTRHLISDHTDRDRHYSRCRNAIHQLMASGELEVYDETNHRTQGQRYRKPA